MANDFTGLERENILGNRVILWHVNQGGA